MELTIKRSEWLHGEGRWSASYLLRKSDGKKCCLGFYALALGADPEAINDRKDPMDQPMPFIGRADWLFAKKGDAFGIPNSRQGLALMTANDKKMNEAAREARITEIFARHDVQVNFVD